MQVTSMPIPSYIHFFILSLRQYMIERLRCNSSKKKNAKKIDPKKKKLMEPSYFQASDITFASNM